ncbi:uncharacterized protein LOC116172142 [Photinus pyralis]|uniref:uncharacterized protein LOC116172142 n=1 Tax=Photinus pyralis TaxID=7054 RepID=UPI001266F74E|nr:uncharacterized protein LOC116172142 [Photinus pyralis]
MYDHISGALEQLIRKANLLIENENNNAVECLMNIVSRFNMGKRTNLGATWIIRKTSLPGNFAVQQIVIFSTEATENDIAKESVAIKAFEKKQNVTVTNTGLWIHKDYGFLGASPDGLVGTDTIVEVKCLYSCSKLEETGLEKILRFKKKTCLQLKDGKTSLNRRHSYCYQVQGTLNIAKRSKCYFVVYINDAVPLYREEIEIDINFWEHEMVPILITFYKMCIAPEIIRTISGKDKSVLIRNT